MTNLCLFLTNSCSLRCKYCIQNKHQKNMPIEIAFSAIDYFKEKHTDNFAAIMLYGGEVFMLDNDYLINILSYFKKQFGEKIITFGASTNLYYNFEYKIPVFEFIKYNFNDYYITISIDGNKTSHDINRITDNGIGSYDVVISNAIKLKQIFPNIVVNYVVTPNNIEYLADGYIDIINKLGIYNIRIGFDKYIDFSDTDLIKLKTQLSKLYDLIIQNDHNIFYKNNQFNTNPNGSHKCFCTASTNKQIVVDEDGNIYPCHLLAPLKMGIIGNIYNSTINQIELGDCSKYYGIQNCSNCQNKRCHICPAVNYIRNVSFYETNKNYCAISIIYNSFVDRLFKYFNGGDTSEVNI